MENKTPTQEQIKELWELCGFLVEEHNSRFQHWFTYTPPDELKLEWYERHQYPQPPIDPNNLLKYAIPKLDSIRNIRHIHLSPTSSKAPPIEWACVIEWFLPEKDDVFPLGKAETISLAIFWAVYPALKELQHDK